MAAEFAHQCRHLVMGKAEAREVGHGGIEVAVGDPDTLEIQDRLHPRLRDCGAGLGKVANRRIEVRAEIVGDQPGFGRADPFHVRVIR